MMRTVTVEFSMSNADADRFEAGEFALMVTPMEIAQVAEIQHLMNEVGDHLSTLRSVLTALHVAGEMVEAETPNAKSSLSALLLAIDLCGNPYGRVRAMLAKSAFIGRNYEGSLQ